MLQNPISKILPLIEALALQICTKPGKSHDLINALLAVSTQKTLGLK
jgi:hypothetical protein